VRGAKLNFGFVFRIIVLALLTSFSQCVLAQSQPGIITTVAGGAPFVFQERAALQAPLGQITSVAVDASGNVYAADRSNGIVVRITPAGSLSVVFTLSPAITGYFGHSSYSH
jgi:hypothetical protein